jgi:ribosomal protein L12E/L44/L45/RPP1/RPP2
MSNTELQRSLIRIILTLESKHHGCNEEAINIAKKALGYDIEHNHIREMINEINEKRVEEIMGKIPC